MKGLTFDSFIAHDANRAALDLSRKLASLDLSVPNPLVLLGEGGSGKSHLLWAIVNQFRETNVKVGVALISSLDFPAKVKKLGDDPKPLTQSRPTVLLVDDLHLFEKDLPLLEKVVFAFLENSQRCVFATRIHPNVLPTLSGKFKALLNQGSITGIKLLPGSTGAPIPEAALTHITSLRKRIEELERENHDAVKNAFPVVEAVSFDYDQFREELQKALRERNEALAETAQWREKIAELLNRAESLKSMFESRLAALEQRGNQLRQFAGSLAAAAAGDALRALDARNLPENPPEIFLRPTSCQGDDDMATFRMDSHSLANTLDQQEVEITELAQTIRNTLARFSAEADADAERDSAQRIAPLPEDARNALSRIADQLEALSMGPAGTWDTFVIPETPDAFPEDIHTAGDLPPDSSSPLPWERTPTVDGPDHEDANIHEQDEPDKPQDQDQ